MNRKVAQILRIGKRNALKNLSGQGMRGITAARGIDRGAF
jgi:hypothetical protein